MNAVRLRDKGNTYSIWKKGVFAITKFSQAFDALFIIQHKRRFSALCIAKKLDKKAFLGV